MNWNKQQLLAILPQRMRSAEFSDVREIRLRLGQPPRLVTGTGFRLLDGPVGEGELQFPINAASRYSPWNAESLKEGYLTASGGHRIGVCGEGGEHGIRNITSVCIRIARDVSGIAAGMPTDGNLLLLGPPGSGKTTLLRDLIRLTGRTASVAVVDERGEVFPEGFRRGGNTDVLTGVSKPRGIDMVLRSMGPAVIAMDEVTGRPDCEALLRAGWCGVRLLATAHAADLRDLYERPIYAPLVRTGLFHRVAVLDREQNWHLEEVDG